VITGAVVRVAQEHGVEVPLLEYTYALLKAVQADIVRAQGMKDGSGFLEKATL
jgi:ketopantoate reductase